jgi:hypothetical protein
MLLPDAPLALVDRAKITDYLLNRAHPDNGGKAAFFVGIGFSTGRPEVLAEAFLSVVARTSASVVVESEHGRKYIVDGQIDTPTGRRPWVRTIWIIDRGADVPRLVTAYPYLEKSKP